MNRPVPGSGKPNGGLGDTKNDADLRTAERPRSVSAPADQFYWAVLAVPGLSKRRKRHPGSAEPLPPGLTSELAELAPIPVDSLHAVCLAVPRCKPSGAVPQSNSLSEGILADRRVLVCAAPVDALDQLPDSVIEFKPASIPEFIDLSGGPAVPPTDVQALAAKLNLRTGRFESPLVRRDRFRRHVLKVGVVAICAACVFAGLVRRAAAMRGDLLRTHRENEVLLAALADQGVIRSPTVSSLRDSAAVCAAAQALRTQSLALGAVPTAGAPPSSDAAAALASLLNAWPSPSVPLRDAEGSTGNDDLRGTIKPLSINVTPSSMQVSVLLDRVDPASFTHEFRAPPGWTIAEPRLNRVDGQMTRLNLSFSRHPAAEAPR